MKQKIVAAIAVVFLLFQSCKNETSQDNFADESVNSERITKTEDLYSGVFEGKLMQDNVSLELDEDAFDLKINDKSFSGKINQMDDGESFELIAENGKIPYSKFRFSDEYSLVLLNESIDEEGNSSLVPVEDAFLDKETENE